MYAVNLGGSRVRILQKLAGPGCEHRPHSKCSKCSLSRRWRDWRALGLLVAYRRHRFVFRVFFSRSSARWRLLAILFRGRASVEKRRKKSVSTREGWEDGTPPPHKDFKERGVMR